MDPKAVLRTQLDSAICEAWIEYQSNANFRKAWDQASGTWERRDQKQWRHERSTSGARGHASAIALLKFTIKLD